ncbi:hypothetical protein CLAIMM_06271 [Cladophialophora immunda]|nr:hypothetical protein CLAIMM_06271 [Cladophialophora immunda]
MGVPSISDTFTKIALKELLGSLDAGRPWDDQGQVLPTARSGIELNQIDEFPHEDVIFSLQRRPEQRSFNFRKPPRSESPWGFSFCTLSYQAVSRGFDADFESSLNLVCAGFAIPPGNKPRRELKNRDLEKFSGL